MGSVGFDVEDESQPSTSSGKKYKLPRTLLSGGGGAVNHAPVPRKLRSAVKKRGREAITIPLPISRKKCRALNGVEKLGKSGARKSKQKTKKGQITKDEEEVAEALYTLAGMFSDTNKSNPEVDDDQPKAKSPPVLEGGSSMNSVEDNGTLKPQVESTKISSNSTTQAIKFESLGDAEQPELPSIKQSASPIASGVQCDSTLLHRLSASDMKIEQQQSLASGTQFDMNYHPIHDKNYNGVFPLPTLSVAAPESSKSQGFRKRLPAWFEKTNYASQPPATEKSVITSEKLLQHTRVKVESKKSWKRCSAHVYIGRLIKVLQVSERREGLLMENPTQVVSSQGADLWTHHPNIHNQITSINGRNDGVSFSRSEKNSSEIQNELLHKKAIQDQQLAPAAPVSSSKQGYDFLSLGMAVDTGVSNFNTRKGVKGAADSPEQFHAPQNHSAMLFSLSQNGYSYSSDLAAQQVQIPQYIGSTFNSNVTHQLELQQQQQKWAAQLQARYNGSGGGVSDWIKGARDPPSVLNYAHALFPQFHAAALQFSIPQQQLVAMNSSLPPPNVKKHYNNRNRLPLRLERNGAAIGTENILQMPCNQRF